MQEEDYDIYKSRINRMEQEKGDLFKEMSRIRGTMARVSSS